MPAGRPKTPTVLKELRGTYRKDRANLNEPKPPVLTEVPDAPFWVDDCPQTKSLFDQVTRYVMNMKVATQVDGLALSLLADQLSIYIDLRSQIRKEGITVVDSSGKTKAHAALGQLNNTLTQIHKFLREYGLTAASRSNVSAAEEKDVDAFEDFLK